MDTVESVPNISFDVTTGTPAPQSSEVILQKFLTKVLYHGALYVYYYTDNIFNCLQTIFYLTDDTSTQEVQSAITMRNINAITIQEVEKLSWNIKFIRDLCFLLIIL